MHAIDGEAPRYQARRKVGDDGVARLGDGGRFTVEGQIPGTASVANANRRHAAVLKVFDSELDSRVHSRLSRNPRGGDPR